MELYVSGVVVVAVLGLAELLTILTDTFSTRFKNFNEIGLFFDPITEKFYAHKSSWKVWTFFIANLILITPLFSWLSIGLLIIKLIKKYMAKSRLPDKIKEIEYKLSAFILPKDETTKLVDELNMFYYGYKGSEVTIPQQRPDLSIEDAV